MNVSISHIKYDGEVKRTEADEYVMICNNGGSDANISGWRVNAGDSGQDFTFPAGTVLKAGEKCRVYTNQVRPSSGRFKFGSGRAIWNNAGDVGRLYDDDDFEVSTYRYGPPKVKVCITHIEFDGKNGRREKDEYIMICNEGASDADISGWRVHADDKGQNFTFPEDTTLEVGKKFRVYTNEVRPSSGGFKFGSRTAIWNNEGDVGRLYNADGKEVSKLGYGKFADVKA